MELHKLRIKESAKATGISEEDLTAFLTEGEERVYKPNEWLFHESSPRQWAGIILDGDVELVRGLHGSSRHVGTMIAGALISEGAFLDGDSHSNSGYTRNGATIWLITSEKIEEYRQKKPELFYRIVSRVAVGVNRGRHFFDRIIEVDEIGDVVGTQRVIGGEVLLSFVEVFVAADRPGVEGIIRIQFEHP